jgi:hypothetical protein
VIAQKLAFPAGQKEMLVFIIKRKISINSLNIFDFEKKQLNCNIHKINME